MVFYRVCSQEYYQEYDKVVYDDSHDEVTPWDEASLDHDDHHGRRGYLMLPASEPFEWSMDDTMVMLQWTRKQREAVEYALDLAIDERGSSTKTGIILDETC